LYRQGKLVGGAFVGLGQEAIAVGSTYALEQGDVIAPLIRDAGAYFVKGETPQRFLANYLGKSTGPTHGKDGNMHFGDLSLGIFAPISMLAGMIPVCCGAALAFKVRGEKRVALTWIGDGGSNVGDFHEGMNFAAVLQLPVVVILENNGYAYSTPVEKQARLKDFVLRAQEYGIPGEMVDGNDVLAVYEVTKGAVDRARAGGGPTLIEAKTFRMKGHAEHDDASYVPPEILDAWRKKDPIDRFERYLLEGAILNESTRTEIQERVKREIEDAERFALESPFPPPEEAAEGVYAR